MFYRAVIFDLDGTLLDTLEDIANAANHVLAEKAFAVHPVASYQQLICEGVSQLIMRALSNTKKSFVHEYWKSAAKGYLRTYRTR